jgi:hypothetical protein
VLPRATRDLEDQAGGRQHAAEDLKDRLAVPLRGGGVQAALGRGGRIEEGRHR